MSKEAGSHADECRAGRLGVCRLGPRGWFCSAGGMQRYGGALLQL